MFERLRDVITDGDQEAAHYVRLVLDTDGTADRVAWLRRR